MIHLLFNKRLFDKKFISVAVDYNLILTSVHGLNLKKSKVISLKLINSGF